MNRVSYLIEVAVKCRLVMWERVGRNLSCDVKIAHDCFPLTFPRRRPLRWDRDRPEERGALPSVSISEFSFEIGGSVSANFCSLVSLPAGLREKLLVDCDGIAREG